MPRGIPKKGFRKKGGGRKKSLGKTLLYLIVTGSRASRKAEKEKKGGVTEEKAKQRFCKGGNEEKAGQESARKALPLTEAEIEKLQQLINTLSDAQIEEVILFLEAEKKESANEQEVVLDICLMSAKRQRELYAFVARLLQSHHGEYLSIPPKRELCQANRAAMVKKAKGSNYRCRRRTRDVAI